MIRILIRFWVRKGRLIWSKIYRFLFEWRYKKYSLPKISDNLLLKLQYILLQITWTPDPWYMLFDVIPLPQKVWKTKKDDCDGFAILAAAILKQSDINEVVLLTVVGSPIKHSHTVCCFKLNDQWYVADNQVVYRSVSNNLEKIAEYYLKKLFRKPYCWQIITPELKELKYVECE